MKSSRSPETTLQEREAVPAPWTPLTCSCAPGAWHPGQGTGVAWLLSGTGGGGGGGQGRRGTGPPHHGACIRLSLPAPAPASSAVTSLHGHEITAHEGTHLGHESPGQRCQRPVQQAHETEPPHPEAAAWPGGAARSEAPGTGPSLLHWPRASHPAGRGHLGAASHGAWSCVHPTVWGRLVSPFSDHRDPYL